MVEVLTVAPTGTEASLCVRVVGTVSTTGGGGTKTPADGTANPTDATDSESFNMAWNGATWDRVRSGTAIGSLKVNNDVAANLKVDASGTTVTTVGNVTPADAEANPTNTVPTEAHTMVFNGTTWDRVRAGSAAGAGAGGTGFLAAAPHVTSGGQFFAQFDAFAPSDANDGRNTALTHSQLYNNATFDRARSATGVTDGMTPTGVAAVVPMYMNAGNATRAISGGGFGDASPGNSIGINALAVFNGATWDRNRSVGIGDTQTTGIPASGLYTFNGTTWDRLRSGGVTGMAGVSGDTASAAADAGNPVKIGGVARTSDITAVTNGQRVNATLDTLGKQVFLQGATNDRIVSGTTNYTTTTAADVIAAQGVGVRIVVTSILVTNFSTATNTKVEIRDGTTVKVIGAAWNSGGGFARDAGGVALFISTANAAVTARCVTTGADVDVSISGYLITN